MYGCNEFYSNALKLTWIDTNRAMETRNIHFNDYI